MKAFFATLLVSTIAIPAMASQRSVEQALGFDVALTTKPSTIFGDYQYATFNFYYRIAFPKVSLLQFRGNIENLNPSLNLELAMITHEKFRLHLDFGYQYNVQRLTVNMINRNFDFIVGIGTEIKFHEQLWLTLSARANLPSAFEMLNMSGYIIPTYKEALKETRIGLGICYAF
jgi:hypothetical protein